MSEIIRVAQIIGNANAGGVESVIMNLYKNIDRTKVQFDFFVEQTCSIIDREIIESMGGKIVIIPAYKHLFKYEKELKRLFKEGGYKIVHSNMNTISVFTLRAAKKAGVKIRIAHSHSMASPKEILRSALKYALRPFSKVYANYYFTCSNKAGIWQFGKRTFNKGLITLIPNAIDINKFTYSDENRNVIRKEYNIPEDAFVLGHVGRFVTVKNHGYLLNVFAEVVKQQPNSRLLIVGDGPLKEEIVAKAKELNVLENIVFTGVQKNTAPFYAAMDAFILPSLYEGLPVVGVEAQASGLKVIFSDVVTQEAKLSDKTSYRSIKENPAEWAKELLEGDYDYDRSKCGESLIKTDYNITNSANKLVEKYFECLKEQYHE